MKQIILILSLFLFAFSLIQGEEKNALYYLKSESKTLNSYYKQVKKQSLQKDYPFFRGRKIIEHSVYTNLSNEEKQALKGNLVLSKFILHDFIKYSNLGGIGVGGILSSDYGDKNAREFYLKFDGRYLSDLELLGIGTEIYSYCVLPNFNQCILLGIGEDWK